MAHLFIILFYFSHCQCLKIFFCIIFHTFLAFLSIFRPKFHPTACKWSSAFGGSAVPFGWVTTFPHLTQSLIILRSGFMFPRSVFSKDHPDSSSPRRIKSPTTTFPVGYYGLVPETGLDKAGFWYDILNVHRGADVAAAGRGFPCFPAGTASGWLVIRTRKGLIK
jgi:hypothetical protein